MSELGLGNVPLFEGLSPQELARVAELSSQVDVVPGAVLVDQGDPGTFCFVILSGNASVYMNGEYVATSGPGVMVGEMALHDLHPRTATVVANSEMSLLRFDIRAFRALLEEMPRASERIQAVLAQRLGRRNPGS
jgi:CRP-like cAMP-binding protein